MSGEEAGYISHFNFSVLVRYRNRSGCSAFGGENNGIITRALKRENTATGERYENTICCGGYIDNGHFNVRLAFSLVRKQTSKAGYSNEAEEENMTDNSITAKKQSQSLF